MLAICMRYANKKNKRYNKTITEKELDLNYQSFIVETFGAFASDTWKFINTVCDPNTHPNANDDEYNPWNNCQNRSTKSICDHADLMVHMVVRYLYLRL